MENFIKITETFPSKFDIVFLMQRKTSKTINTKTEIDIVTPSQNDMQGMQEVFYKSWLSTYPNKEVGITVDDIEYRFKDSFTEEALEKRWQRIQNTQNEKILLAKKNTKVVGLLRVTFHTDKYQLKAFYVLPEYKRKGIGTLLWKEITKLFREKKDILVHVATYNTGAISFYKKLGFKDTGKRWSNEEFRMKSGSIIPEMEMAIKVTDN